MTGEILITSLKPRYLTPNFSFTEKTDILPIFLVTTGPLRKILIFLYSTWSELFYYTKIMLICATPLGFMHKF